MSVAIVIPSYNGAKRLRFMLDTVEQNDPASLDVQWLIVEDPCPYDGVSKAYDQIAKDYSIPVWHLDEWSNMHGAAKKAFEIVFKVYEPDWVIYLGDDLAITKGSLSNLIHFVTNNPLNTIGLVQPPYWNSHEISKSGAEDETNPKLFWSKERDFYASTDWVQRVPRNPHWKPQPYINVNGAGFAAKSSVYREVGGFADVTWCLDESLSVRTWLKSDQSIVSIGGPPLVHYFGASSTGHHTANNLSGEALWIEAMGMDKKTAGELCYKKLCERKAAVEEEMRECFYYE